MVPARHRCASCGDGVIGECTYGESVCAVRGGCPAGSWDCTATVCSEEERRTPELCDGDRLPTGVDCRSLGYAGGTLRCAPSCDRWDETDCDPCEPTAAVADCRTTEREAGGQLAIATNAGQIAVVSVGAAECAGSLQLSLFDAALQPIGASRCLRAGPGPAVGPLDVTAAAGGGFLLVAARPEDSVVLRVSPSGRAQQVARLPGRATGFAHRATAADPVVVVSVDADGQRLTLLTDRGAVAETRALPETARDDRSAAAVTPDGMVVVSARVGSASLRVMAFGPRLEALGSTQTSVGSAGVVRAAWDGTAVVTVFELRSDGHPLHDHYVVQRFDTRGAPLGEPIPLIPRSGAGDVIELAAVGASVWGMAYTMAPRDPPRATSYHLLRVSDRPAQHGSFAAVTTALAFDIAPLDDGALVAGWILPRTSRLRLARLAPPPDGAAPP